MTPSQVNKNYSVGRRNYYLAAYIVAEALLKLIERSRGATISPTPIELAKLLGLDDALYRRGGVGLIVQSILREVERLYPAQVRIGRRGRNKVFLDAARLRSMPREELVKVLIGVIEDYGRRTRKLPRNVSAADVIRELARKYGNGVMKP